MSPIVPARVPPLVFRANGLRGILDDLQTVLARGQGHQRIHIGGLAVQMHRHDRPDAAAGGAVDQPIALRRRSASSMNVRTAAGDKLKV